MRSGGIASSRCCSMPTFFNPGGRTFAGGDMMPWVMPCAQAWVVSRSIAANNSHLEHLDFIASRTALVLFLASSQSAVPTTSTMVTSSAIRPPCISVRPARLKPCPDTTLLFRCWGFPRLLPFAHRCSKILCVLRTRRQAALRHEFHGPLDRNMDHTCLLVHPAVAVQLLFFFEAEVVDLQPLVPLKARLRKLGDVFGRDHARVSFRRLHQRALRGLMRFLIRVQVGVHPSQNEKKQHADNSQPDQKAEHALGAQVLPFELAAGAGFPVFDRSFTHAPVQVPPWRIRHTRAEAASNSGCGRSKPATGRPSLRGQPRPPKSRSIFRKSSVRSSRKGRGSASASAKPPARPTAARHA